MNTENLGELFAALAMARQEFGTLTKGKTASIRSEKGASYTYSYADLSDVIEATAAALAKHGLVVIQEPEVISDGGRQLVVINGCIAHKSGAIYQLRSLPLPVAGGTAQAIGSAISYGRRYQLSAALNLAAADDDGNEAGIGTNTPRSAQKAQKPTSAPKRTVDTTTGEILEPVKDVEFGMGNGKHAENPFEVDQTTDQEPEKPVASKSQLNKMHALGMEFHGSKDEWNAARPVWVKKASHGDVTSSKELSPKQVDWIIASLEKRIAETKAESEAQTELEPEVHF